METKRIGTFTTRHQSHRHWVTLTTDTATRVVRIATAKGVPVGDVLRLAVLEWLARQERT